jgi:hypothetical protein
MPRPVAAIGAILLASAAIAGELPAVPNSSLHEVRSIELPGVRGRIDHFAVDLEGQRLFVAALGADQVEIVDLKSGKRIAQLTGFREPQGLVYVPPLRRLFVAAGESGEVVAFDGDKRVGVTTGLPDADNMRYSASTGRLVVGYGSGLAMLDPATLAIVARIALPGHPEAFELAEKGPQIFVNVPDVGRIVVVDRNTAKSNMQWAIAPDVANFPMALDEAAHRLYVGTRRPARVLAFDTTTGHRAAQAPLCGDVDDLFLDPAQARLMAVCGEGAVDELPTPDLDEGRTRRTRTAAGARTGLYVPSTNTLFIAAPAGILGVARIIEYLVK